MINFTKIFSEIVIDPGEINVPMTDPDPATTSTLPNVIERVLPIVFGVAGAVASLVIVIAGILFILSRGDPQKSAVARNAIIYAGVGLAISVAAFSIVGFVAEGL